MIFLRDSVSSGTSIGIERVGNQQPVSPVPPFFSEFSIDFEETVDKEQEKNNMGGSLELSSVCQSREGRSFARKNGLKILFNLTMSLSLSLSLNSSEVSNRTFSTL